MYNWKRDQDEKKVANQDEKMRKEITELNFRPKISEKSSDLADEYWKRKGMKKLSIFDRC
jgi:hypothetical protein